MANPAFVSVASGFTVSSGFVLDRPERAFVVTVPISTTGIVGLQFATTDPTATAVASAAFSTLQRPDYGPATVGPYQVFSGAAGGMSAAIQPPTPWLRLLMSAAQTLTNTFAIFSVAAPD